MQRCIARNKSLSSSIVTSLLFLVKQRNFVLLTDLFLTYFDFR